MLNLAFDFFCGKIRQGTLLIPIPLIFVPILGPHVRCSYRSRTLRLALQVDESCCICEPIQNCQRFR